MNYAKINTCDIANGDGVRVSLFVSGCTHYCKGCFNDIAWDFNYGEEFTQETIDTILKVMEPWYIKGLTLLGGEPLEIVNQRGLVELLRQVKKRYRCKDIWCYTGYTYEKDIPQCEVTEELLGYVDVLVDGEFILEERDPSLRFRGSRNQRIIELGGER